MQFHTRHMALCWYGLGATIAMILRPDILSSVESVALLFGPLTGMFVWDKIKSGSAVKTNK